jgi:hypothetical protein
MEVGIDLADGVEVLELGADLGVRGQPVSHAAADGEEDRGGLALLVAGQLRARGPAEIAGAERHVRLEAAALVARIDDEPEGVCGRGERPVLRAEEDGVVGDEGAPGALNRGAARLVVLQLDLVRRGQIPADPQAKIGVVPDLGLVAELGVAGEDADLPGMLALLGERGYGGDDQDGRHQGDHQSAGPATRRHRGPGSGFKTHAC